MRFDIFFSICQTPVDGHTPTEAEMYRNFFQQVEAADAQGYGTAWVAESHLSIEVQKRNANPVVPHFPGEIGLNADIFQLANHVFNRTKNIHVGSAVMNLLVNGGPIGAAERIATFATLHGANPDETRKLNIGFSAGRFEFMNRAHGIVARNALEQAAWPAMRGKVFAEACEIFCRLLKGEVLNSTMTAPTTLTRANFRSDEDWAKVQAAAADAGLGKDLAEVPIDRRFEFEDIKIVPQDWRRDVVNLIIGSHEPSVQDLVNQWLPVMVFNLSITKPDVIEATHARMAKTYHADGGPWQRWYMPRTVFVFINEQPGLTPAQRSAAAKEEAQHALEIYWKALEGTIDPMKINNAANNALIGNADEVAEQVRERFHKDDRLMLWFDFFNHDSNRVVANQEAFMAKVAPKLA